MRERGPIQRRGRKERRMANFKFYPCPGGTLWCSGRNCLHSPPPPNLILTWMSGFSLIKGSAELTSLNFASQSDQPRRRISKFFSELGRSFPLLSDRKFRVGRKRFSREEVLGHQVVMQRGTDGDRDHGKGEFDSNRRGGGPQERSNYLIAGRRDSCARCME